MSRKLVFLLVVSSFILGGCAFSPSPLFSVSEPVFVTNTGSYEENWAALCPNGQLLITRAVEEQGVEFLYRIGILNNDGIFTQLTPKSSAQDVKPDWSPNCREITFERLEGDATGVYIMSVDGTDIRQAMDTIPTHLHAYAPRWSANPNIMVVTLSDCQDCVPENSEANTSFGVIRLDQGGKTYIINPPAMWGYMSNASFNDDGDGLIFSVGDGAYFQLATVQNIFSTNPNWKILTTKPIQHVRPVYLPTRNDAVIFTGIDNGRLDIFLLYNGEYHNLTKAFGPCKDADVVKKEKFEIIATCDTAAGISDFVMFNLTLH